MELVNPLQVLGLAEQHQVGIAARAHQREGPQQVTVGEILAGCGEFPLVGGAAIVVQPAPGRVHLQERVLDEVPDGHARAMIGHRNPVAGPG